MLTAAQTEKSFWCVPKTNGTEQEQQEESWGLRSSRMLYWLAVT